MPSCDIHGIDGSLARKEEKLSYVFWQACSAQEPNYSHSIAHTECLHILLSWQQSNIDKGCMDAQADLPLYSSHVE